MAVIAEPVSKPKPMSLARFLPILDWLPRIDVRTGWRPDVIAGLTLWGLVAPEAMAYAGIAGLPPQAGLYTLLASLLIYALLGTSRHLIVQDYVRLRCARSRRRWPLPSSPRRSPTRPTPTPIRSTRQRSCSSRA